MLLKKTKINHFLRKRISLEAWLKIASLVISLIILAFLYKKGIVAIAFVDGDPITFSQLYRVYKDEGPKNILDKVIAEKLVELEVRRRNIVVRKEEIDAEILKTEKEAIANGKTLAQILSEKDQTLAEFQKNTKFRLLIYKILEDDIAIDDDKIERIIEENEYLFKDADEAERAHEEIRKLLIEAEIQKQYEFWIKEAKAQSDIKYLVNF